jgi:hypothetical protein
MLVSVVPGRWKMGQLLSVSDLTSAGLQRPWLRSEMTVDPEQFLVT